MHLIYIGRQRISQLSSAGILQQMTKIGQISTCRTLTVLYELTVHLCRHGQGFVGVGQHGDEVKTVPDVNFMLYA